MIQYYPLVLLPCASYACLLGRSLQRRKYCTVSGRSMLVEVRCLVHVARLRGATVPLHTSTLCQCSSCASPAIWRLCKVAPIRRVGLCVTELRTQHTTSRHVMNMKNSLALYVFASRFAGHSRHSTAANTLAQFNSRGICLSDRCAAFALLKWKALNGRQIGENRGEDWSK